MKILLIDDHQLFLQGLEQLLSDYATELVASDNAESALETINDISPDLILIDLGMPGMDGLSFIKAIEARQLLIPIVVLSATDDINKIRQVLDAGAFGFIPKSVNRESLIEALEVVRSGSVFLPAAIKEQLSHLRQSRRSNHDDHRISERQIQILTLLSKGYSNKKISLILYISEETVKTHLRNIFQTLYVSSRTEAVTRALELDLLDL